MFDENDKAIARSLCKNKETLKFLEKMFTPEVDPIDDVIDQQVIALDDADYGRLMKVSYLTKQSFKAKMGTLRRLGGEAQKGAGAIAPK